MLLLAPGDVQSISWGWWELPERFWDWDREAGAWDHASPKESGAACLSSGGSCAHSQEKWGQCCSKVLQLLWSRAVGDSGGMWCLRGSQSPVLA